MGGNGGGLRERGDVDVGRGGASLLVQTTVAEPREHVKKVVEVTRGVALGPSSTILQLLGVSLVGLGALNEFFLKSLQDELCPLLANTCTC